MSRIPLAPRPLAVVVALTSASPILAAGTPLPGTQVDALRAFAAKQSELNAVRRQEAVELARRQGLPIREEFRDGRIVELQRLGAYGEPIYYTTLNAAAADSVSTDELWPGGSRALGLTGSGMTVGEWDGGAVRTSHDELTGRVTQQDGAVSLSNHATHVAGTLIASGADSSAKGMAYQSALDAYDWNDDTAEMGTAAGGGLLLSNHSYGLITGWYYRDSNDASEGWYWYGNDGDTEDYKFGYYNSTAAAWDELAVDAPYYLIVKSAGNDRNDAAPAAGTSHYVWGGSAWTTSTATRDNDCAPSGYDCIGTAGTAKNILTVGAVGDISGGWTASGDVQMSSFSGWGPTDDGRIKPDIVGNGVGVYSSVAGGDSQYSSYSGTSMSSPNVTGSLLLLQQHYQDTHAGASMRSATLKALAIHTADEAGNFDGPDYEYGWGMLSAAGAADVISADGTDAFIIEGVLIDGGSVTLDLLATGGEPVKATLVWTDPAGVPVTAAVDPTDSMLVHDLDLRLTSGATTYQPWVLDPANPGNAATTGDNVRDNVEQVVITGASANDAVSMTIDHKGSLTTAGQNYSLIITGAAASLHTVTASAGAGGSVSPSSVGVVSGAGASFTVTADSGYTADTVVGGTCAAGAWSGITYTTGAVEADCSVSFTFTPIGGFLDNTQLAWATSGDAAWFGQSTTVYHGGDAAQSGALTHDQSSHLGTTVTGPGTLTFYWKVSSESNFDYLSFYINDVLQARISGSVDWVQRSYPITSGSQTLRWTYAKDESISSGSDAGWLDYVTYTRDFTEECSLSNRTYTAGEIVLCEDASSIQTGNAVTVSSGAEVTYRAPSVVLNPGFTAAAGSTFRAVAGSPTGTMAVTAAADSAVRRTGIAGGAAAEGGSGDGIAGAPELSGGQGSDGTGQRTAQPAAIPLFSGWAYLLLTLLLGAGAWRRLRPTL